MKSGSGLGSLEKFNQAGSDPKNFDQSGAGPEILGFDGL